MRNFLIVFSLCLTLCMAFEIQRETKFLSDQKVTRYPLDLSRVSHYENPWTGDKSVAKCKSDELMVQIKGSDDNL